jgi:putative transposase
MEKTFKFRLYPGKEQRRVLEETLQICRVLYNGALAERKEAWGNEGRSVSYYEQKRALVQVKKASSCLKKVHSQVLQDVILRLDRAFQGFYRRIRNGEKPGYPRFKGKGRYDSFTYPQYGNGARIIDRKLVLSKIGEVNIKLHREIEGIVKTCTIKRDVDRWYACFVVELPDAVRVTPKTAVGVDVGVTHLAALSTGETFENPKHLRRAEKKLAREQRRLSRKKKGSRNRGKQRLRVARAHRNVRNQRLDFMHKLSRRLVDAYDLIAFEDLRVGNMLQNHHMTRSISDASWSMLQWCTAYKAEEAGKAVAFVAPNGTSQECSSCGAIVEKDLAVRTHRCPICGLALDRDVNAAINILKRAIVLSSTKRARFPKGKNVGQELADLMPAGGFPLGTPLKQEAHSFSWG